MTETRTCKECGKRLITHRSDARFCGKDCNNVWHNRQRRRDAATDKHLTGGSGGVGSRGGNVRSVDEARILQSESKERDRWRLVMEIQIHRTLLSTGFFHVDDLDALEAPGFAIEGRGTLVNAVRQRGHMKSTNVQRKVAHPAANARKAWIYGITAKGRRELPKLLEAVRVEIAGVHTAAASGAVDGGGVDSGERSAGEKAAPPCSRPAPPAPGAASPDTASGAPVTPAPGALTAESLGLLPEPDSETWAA